MKTKRINKVRALLLVYIDKESCHFLASSCVKINHIVSKEFVKRFESDYIITFDNSLVRGTECRPAFAFRNDNLKERNTSNSHSQSAIFYKCVQEIGKSFIEERKIDLGSRKLGFKNTLGIQTNDERSFKEKLKSSQSVQRYKKSKFAILSKRERKEKVIQDNYHYLNIIVKKLKISPIEENENCVYLDINGVSPFHCNLPVIHTYCVNSNYLKEEHSNTSNDCVDWITPFKNYDCNKEISENIVYQTETEACRSIITITPTQQDRTKTDNVSSFSFETENVM